MRVPPICHRRLALEPLERRVLLAGGEIHGGTWYDSDGNGQRDPGELGLAGAVVYLDLNQNGQLDSSEPNTVTRVDDPATPDIDETGTYRLTNLDPGDYAVSEVVPQGYSRTFPAASDGTGELLFVERLADGDNGVEGLEGARSVTVSPDGGHVYAAGTLADAVDVFRRDPTTGELDLVQVLTDGQDRVDGLDEVRSLALSPDGRNVYVAGYYDDAVAVFSREPTTGELTFVQMFKDGVNGVDGLRYASCVTVSPDGGHVYATGLADSAVAVFQREPATGELTFLEVHRDGQDGVDGLHYAGSVVVSIDGSHVYAAGTADDAVAVFLRNPATGRLTFVQVLHDGEDGVDGLDGASSLAVSPDGGNVYATGPWDKAVAVFRRDPATGRLTSTQVLYDEQNDVDGLRRAQSVTVSSDGSNVYVTGSGDDSVAVFRRDTTTGKLDFVHVLHDEQGGVDGLDGASSVAVSPDGDHVFVAGPDDGALAVFSRDHARRAPYHFALVPGQIVENVDFGNRIVFGEIRGGIFSDLNGDAVWDADESGLGDWKVYLDLNANGQWDDDEPFDATDVEGGFAFAAVIPGNYAVAEVERPGWVATGATVIEVEVGPGQTTEAVDFGYRALPGEVQGSAWHDLDGNGRHDPDEPGLPGVVVYLDLNQNGQLDPDEPITTAQADDPATPSVDETGTYRFVGLAPDTYTVVQIVPEGYAQTFPDRAVGGGELTFVQMLKDGREGVDGLDGAHSVALSPDGRHLYVAAYSDFAVTVFRREPANGRLTFVQVIKDRKDGQDGVDGLYCATYATVSPDGRHVYVAGGLDDALVVFRRDEATGELTFVQTLKDGVDGIDGLDWIHWVFVSPDGRHVYTAGNLDDAVSVFRREPATGELTFVQLLKDGEAGLDSLKVAHSLDISPDGRHVYVTAAWDHAITVFDRDPITGELTAVQVLRDDQDGVDGLYVVYSVIVSPDGNHVYVAGSYEDSVAVFRRNATTGKLTFVQVLKDGQDGVQGLDYASSVTISPDGNDVYVGGYYSDAVAVFRRDPVTGKLAFVQVLRDNQDGVDGLYRTRSLTISRDGNHLYAAGVYDDAVVVFDRDNIRILAHRLDVAPGQIVEGVDFGSRLPTVAGRYVFYNSSAFDGDDPAPTEADDDAIAADKTALLPSGVASFDNYTSYSRGINGVMVDVAGPAVTPTAADFLFHVGNDGNPADWTPVSTPAAIDVREGAGVDGSDRVTLIWPDHTIRNRWLRVTVLADRLGLAGDDVFYFGSAVADAGNAAPDAQVTSTDLLLARNNPRNFLNAAAVDFPFDYNRDRRVNATDVLLARNNQTNFLTALRLIHLPEPDGDDRTSRRPGSATRATLLVT